MGFTPSSGEELQSELFVAAADAAAAMQTLVDLHDVLAPVLMISEVRAVAADTLWMSPCYQRDCIAFHFTWVPSWSEVEPVLRNDGSGARTVRSASALGQAVDARAARSSGRGSHASTPSNNSSNEWDPTKKFRNPYLENLFG